MFISLMDIDVHVLVDLLLLIIMGLVRMMHMLPEDSGLMLLMFISLLNIDVQCSCSYPPTHHHGTGQDDARVSSGQWSLGQ